MKLLPVLVILAALQPSPSHHRVPEEVSSQEYQVYSLWIDHHLGQQFIGDLYIVDHTKAFNPHIFPCNHPLNPVNHSEDAYVFDQLSGLGNKTFPFSAGQKEPNFHLSIPYKAIGEMPTVAQGLVLQFSRVAFTDDGTGALFSVNEKQSGEKPATINFVFANKIDDHWTFSLMC
jgi:hypothetical protein